MNTKTSLRKAAETVAGTAIGAAIAGPLGAVAGGLAAKHVESDIDDAPQRKRKSSPGSEPRSRPIFKAAVKRILVPVDFSEPSLDALRFAKKWAAHPRAVIRLVHVVDPNTSLGEFGIVPMGQVQSDQVKRARMALEELHRREFNHATRVTLCVRKGAAYDQIVAEARRFNADMIVIARHGQSGLSRALLGSTTERVVRHAHCPVLALPQTQ